MKKLLYLIIFLSTNAFAQPVCDEYTSVGDAMSPYILTSDPACAICPGTGADGPWSGFGCAGTIVSTAIAPTLSLTLAYTAVNLDDFATISIDGGGVMSITGVNVGVAGDVIGPYLCGGSYGDVFITVTSTLPFTTVTLVNTGCSSGWVIACPSTLGNAGSDSSIVVCGGITVLSDLLSDDAELGGTWTETSGSGFFDDVTLEFDTDLAGPGIYTFEYEVTGCGGGVDIANFTITVEEANTAGADNAITVCSGIVVLSDLLSGDADAGGVWSETTGSGFFDVITTEFDAGMAGAGVYTFEYEIIGCGGVPDIAVFTVTVDGTATAGADNATELCNFEGSTLDLNTLLVGADAGGTWVETTASGAFDEITGVFDASGLTPGDFVFKYTVIVPPPCPEDVAEFVVKVNPIPVITITSDPDPAVICVGDVLSLTGSGAGVGGTYVWDHGITNAVPFEPTIGMDTYIVVGTDANSCVGTNSITIDVHPLPNVSFIADTLFGCFPFPVVFTNTTDLASLSCLWEFGDGTSSTDCGVVNHTYTTSGDFSVTLTVETSAVCGGTVTYTNLISVAEMPQANFDYLPNPINVEDTEVSFENRSVYATSYIWQFADGTAPSSEFEPVHVFPTDPNVTYNVRLIAMNNLACADTAFKLITINDVISFFIPNVFTPDGDDFNETFKPIMTSGYDPFDYHLVIYNKWGETVFESFDAAHGWNGTYASGKLVQDGVYIWHIDFGDTITDERHEYQGHVTVLK